MYMIVFDVYVMYYVLYEVYVVVFVCECECVEEFWWFGLCFVW